MTSPLVVNGYVYGGFIYWETGVPGAVAAMNESTGELAWSDDVSADLGGYEDFGTYFSLAAAEGILVAPVMNHLVAYASASPAADP